MEDNQRSAMYNGWKNSKKSTKVFIEEKDNKFIATCDALPELKVIRDSKAQVIYSIAGTLSAQGYEINNLGEIQRIT